MGRFCVLQREQVFMNLFLDWTSPELALAKFRNGSRNLYEMPSAPSFRPFLLLPLSIS
jgi:hypothetical protein